ncbi:MAG: hypothetical protein WB646_06005, partial [Steroidobacteraceae bacterium]
AVALAALWLGGLTGCAVEGGGYGGYGYDGDVGVGVGYVGDYYEPYGYDYGHWGPGYRVGPPHGRDHGPVGHGRSAPSIPNHPRPGGHSGGGHAGGERGDGGHHR